MQAVARRFDLGFHCGYAWSDTCKKSNISGFAVGTGRNYGLLLLIGQFVTVECIAVDACSGVQGAFPDRIAFTELCDVAIKGAPFQQIVVSPDVVISGAVYFESSSYSLSITSTLFEERECRNSGGVVYAFVTEFLISQVCFSYCYAKLDGKIVHSEKSNSVSGNADSQECSFYASYRIGESSSDYSGDGFRVISALASVTYLL
jgi:hypothetical protein